VIIPWDGERVTLVRQHRYTIGREVWELPMGAVDQGGLPAQEVAAQELREETGLAASKWTDLGLLYFAYGMSSQSFNAFLAEGLSQGDRQLEPEEEGMRSGAFTMAEVHELIRTGEIVDAATLSALYLWRGMP
jgi:8-oxo-dGTP pyrophosphatase MutT (NUDIX family)